MNNELLVKQYTLFEKLNNRHVIEKINSFLEKYETEFTTEQSKEAISRIKEFVNGKVKEQTSLELEKEKIRNEIRTTCKHEILRKNYDQAVCLICGHWDFIKEVNYNHFFFEELMYPEENYIYEIIYKIAINDENVFEVFEDYIDNIELNKAKVYKRRIIWKKEI